MFAVDGKCTRDVYGGTEKLLRRTFKSMHVFGETDWWGEACYLHLDPQIYANYLCKNRTAALTDSRFVEEVWKSLCSRATNGIVVQKSRPDLPELMDSCAAAGETTLVVGDLVLIEIVKCLETENQEHERSAKELGN